MSDTTTKCLYYGEFLDVNSVVWRVEIWRRLTAGVTVPRVDELDFSDTPLEIEWGDTAKEEVIAGSSATLHIISPGDRTYTGLYTIPAGDVCMIVYRAGALYWVGSLDPELYQEPFECYSGYEVELTFTDYGILDRLKFDPAQFGSAIPSLYEILHYCLDAASAVGYLNTLDVSAVSSYIRKDSTGAPDTWAPLGGTQQGNGNGLDAVAVMSLNFVDEDGECSTMRAVIEGVLQPLGIRMVQRGGATRLYDLNGLYEARRDTATDIQWDGDSSTLSIDKVANRATVTFSPYMQETFIDGELEQDVIMPPGQHPWIYRTGTDWSNEAEGFRFTVNDGTTPKTCKALRLLSGGAILRLDKINDGDDMAGVIAYYKGAYASSYDEIFGYVGRVWSQTDNTKVESLPLFTLTTTPYLAGFNGHNGDAFRLKVSLEVLADARYNPYETAGDNNEKENADRVQNICNFTYIPVRLEVLDDDGRIIAWYSNSGLIREGKLIPSQQQAGWVVAQTPREDDIAAFIAGDTTALLTSADHNADMLLAYYDVENRKSASGIGNGWATNRQSIGYYREKIPKYISVLDGGEYIPLPPVSGRLRLTVCSGIHQFDYGREVKEDIYTYRQEWVQTGGNPGQGHYETKVGGILRWLAYRNARVTLVNDNGTEVSMDDIEYRAEVNAAACDPIDIDTVCGSYGSDMPTARGIYRLRDGQIVDLIKRAGRVGPPEHLLLGTLCSQYADGKVTLSGDTVLEPVDVTAAVPLYTDPHMVDLIKSEGGGVYSRPKVFMMLGEVQRVREAVSELTVTELRPDEWDEIKEPD